MTANEISLYLPWLQKMRRILVVDDSESVRALVRVTLASSEYAVVEAANGTEAIQLLVTDRGPTPVLIITDLEMPKMTGWEFVRIVKSYHRLASIPVLVISVHEPTNLPEGSMAGYLRKPFGAAELLSAVALLADLQAE